MTDRETLRQRRDELMARLERIRADIAEGLDKDPEDQAIQLENRSALDEIERVTREELRDVQLELEKLGEQ